MASPKLDNLADLGSPPRGGSRGLPSVKPAPPPGTPERRRMKILPSSYMPSTAPMQTPPRHAPPAAIRGMEDTEFNANDAVIREGYLMKLKQTHRWAQHSRWNKRWFQLRGGFLLYFKRQGNDKPAGWLRVAQIREIKPLDSNTLIPGTNRSGENCISICLHTRKLWLRARSLKEAREWMSSIITCMRAAGVELPVGAALTPMGVRVGSRAAAAATPGAIDFAGVTPSKPAHPDSPAADVSPAPARLLQTLQETSSASPAPVSPGVASLKRQVETPGKKQEEGEGEGQGEGKAADKPSPVPTTPILNRRLAALREALDVTRTPPPKSPVTRWTGDEQVEWVEYYDETYQHKYFVNTRTNESAWEIPSKDVDDEDASEWVKCWDYDFDCAYYLNTRTEETSYDLPVVMHGVEPHWYGEGEGEEGEGEGEEGEEGPVVPTTAWGSKDEEAASTPKDTVLSPTSLPAAAPAATFDLEPEPAAATFDVEGAIDVEEVDSGSTHGSKRQEADDAAGAQETKADGLAGDPALLAAFGSGVFVPSHTQEKGSEAAAVSPSKVPAPWEAPGSAGAEATSTPHRGAAPPEDHWVEYWDTTYNCPYFVHSVTGESAWELPDTAHIVQYDEGEFDYTQGFDPETGTYYAHDGGPPPSKK